MMNQETINFILQRMVVFLEMFLATKRLEGRSENTLFLYRFNIGKMLEKAEKNSIQLLQMVRR